MAEDRTAGGGTNCSLESPAIRRIERGDVWSWNIQGRGGEADVEGRPTFVDSWGSACARVVSALPSVGPSRARRIRVIDGDTCEPVSAVPGHVETLTTIVTSRLTARLLAVPWGDRLRLMPPPEQPVTIEQACQLLLSQSLVTNDSSGSVRISRELTLDSEQGLLISGAARLQLANGEVRLLRYLLDRHKQWCSITKICSEAFARTDLAAHKLVWKYASVLRKKLVTEHAILQNSRRLGYRIVTDSAGD